MSLTVEKILAEFKKPYTKYTSVQRWKNKLKAGDYENYCLSALAKFCVEFNINPDELIIHRIEELKSNNPLIRAKSEDRLLAYYKQIAAKKSGAAINMFRRIKSFYKRNYVALQCSDPGYTVQREQDYLPTKFKIHKMCELLDLEAKTYLLVLAEGCGRPGAVAELQWKDIRNEINKEIVPCQIWLQHKVKMTRKKYFSFICADAKEALKLHVERKPRLTSTTKIFKKSYNGLRKEIMPVAAEIGIYDPKEELTTSAFTVSENEVKHYLNVLMCLLIGLTKFLGTFPEEHKERRTRYQTQKL